MTREATQNNPDRGFAGRPTAPAPVEAGLVERLLKIAAAADGSSAGAKAALREAASALSALQSQVEALTREREEARERAKRMADMWSAACDMGNERGAAITDAEAEVTRLRQRVEEMEGTAVDGSSVLPQHPRPWVYDGYAGELLDANGHAIEQIFDDRLGEFIAAGINARRARTKEPNNVA